jgi:hypothetical protein
MENINMGLGRMIRFPSTESNTVLANSFNIMDTATSSKNERQCRATPRQRRVI